MGGGIFLYVRKIRALRYQLIVETWRATSQNTPTKAPHTKPTHPTKTKPSRDVGGGGGGNKKKKKNPTKQKKKNKKSLDGPPPPKQNPRRAWAPLIKKHTNPTPPPKTPTPPPTSPPPPPHVSTKAPHQVRGDGH